MPGQRDLLHVLGGLLGAVLVVVLDGARDVHHLREAHDLFEAVEDQRVLALGLVGLAALGLAALPVALGRAGPVRIAVRLGGGDAFGASRHLAPEGHGQEGPVADRSRETVERHGGIEDRPHLSRAQQRLHRPFHGLFLGRQGAPGARGAQGGAQVGVQPARAGPAGKDPFRRRPGLPQSGHIGLQGVGGDGAARLRMGEIGGQPLVEPFVQSGVGGSSKFCVTKQKLSGWR